MQTQYICGTYAVHADVGGVLAVVKQDNVMRNALHAVSRHRAAANSTPQQEQGCGQEKEPGERAPNDEWPIKAHVFIYSEGTAPEHSLEKTMELGVRSTRRLVGHQYHMASDGR